MVRPPLTATNTMTTKSSIKHQESYEQLYKRFNDVFEQLSMKHSSWNVFEHFLDCALNGFSFNYCQETMDYIRKKYSQDERYQFGELIQLWILIMDKRIATDSIWFDFFGTFYEQQAMAKKGKFAQFFTPEPLCTLMAQMTYSGITNQEFKTILEPSSGSGRNCLAYHAIHQNAFHCAMDIDIVCTKMTALNFMIHGIKGIAQCQDTLNNRADTWRCAFITNDNMPGQIIYVDNYEDCQQFIYRRTTSEFQQYKDMVEATNRKCANPTIPTPDNIEFIPIPNNVIQLSLF